MHTNQNKIVVGGIVQQTATTLDGVWFVGIERSANVRIDQLQDCSVH